MSSYEQLREYYKSKTTRELFEVTLEEDYTNDQLWSAVAELHMIGSAEVFRIAKEFCHSAKSRERVSGLNVLSQLGSGKPIAERPYFEESVSIALKCLQDEDTQVVCSAAYALAHFANKGDNKAVSALIELRGNADSNVRHAVAFGLGGQKDPEAIKTLIGLMDDNDDEVRNWATFGLGFESTGDTPQIREAFRKRLNDPFEEARQEAIWGLAQRKDLEGLRILVARLETDAWVDGDKMAAAEILNLRYSDKTPVEDLSSGLRGIMNTEK